MKFTNGDWELSKSEEMSLFVSDYKAGIYLFKVDNLCERIIVR